MKLFVPGPLPKENMEEFYSYTGLVTENFKVEFYTFAFLILLRDNMVYLIKFLCGEIYYLQVLLLFATFYLFGHMNIRLQPFQSRNLNDREIVFNTVLVLQCLVGMGLCLFGINDAVSTVAFVIVIGFGFIYTLFDQYRDFREKDQDEDQASPRLHPYILLFLRRFYMHDVKGVRRG